MTMTTCAQVLDFGTRSTGKALQRCPVRVDIAGGWLDVPRYSRPGAFVVNLSVTPAVTHESWCYRPRAGIGGSAAWALLCGQDALGEELARAGWQDPAVLMETGLCIWRSGTWPVLEARCNPDWLAGRLGLWWTGNPHDTGALLDRKRDYDAIEYAGRMARIASLARMPSAFGEAMDLSYQAQLGEGMAPLPDFEGQMGHKYCGSGYGGYAVYMFETPHARDTWQQRALARHEEALAIEPFMRGVG